MVVESGSVEILPLATLVGFGVAALAGLAEWLHLRRIRRVAWLAFGETGRPLAWVGAAPAITAVSGGLVAFGLVVLLLQEPEAVQAQPTTEGSRHLLVCFDASPSMYVEDAGPERDQKRAVWAGKLVHGILSRIDTDTTRVTAFAVYTKAIPLVEDTFDLDVVEHLFDGMPFHTAFEPGPTALVAGVEKALEYARRWPEDSATLVVVSDGDAEGSSVVRFRPPSIADSIVIGVGNPTRPTLVAGHRSKQDTESLRRLADSLDALYHQGNSVHLPSGVLDGLTMIRPRIGESVGLRELAFLAIGIGAFAIALLGPALSLFGRRNSRLAVVPPTRMVA